MTPDEEVRKAGMRYRYGWTRGASREETLRHTCDQESLSVAAKRRCVTAGFKRLHADDHGQI
jgi:hypothetical protein